ncbi:MAG: peroxiredoxin-like family protein, partial [Bacteroidota bacterium]
KKASSEKLAGERWDIMSRSTQQLKDRKLSEGALREGDTITSFNLPDVNGNLVSLDQILEEGHAVISFYRGGWCPYCNMELRALQQILPQIKEAGANLIAISPETPDNSLTTSEKNELSFSVLSDVDNQYAKSLGLVFQMPAELQELYASFNLDVKKHNGNDDFELPMPATYVVSKSGKVIKAFVPEDYTERLDPEEVLSALENI